jgi:FkbM family methyltransferase
MGLAKKMRRLSKKIAKVFGYELISRTEHPTLASHVINQIKINQIDFVLDVGANRGQFGKRLRRDGYSGEIHSFEPVSKTFERLSEACSNDKKWFAHKMAVSDSCGKETINITESSLLSSFLNPNNFGKEKFKEMKVSQKETVNKITIDSFMETQIDGLDRRKIFLKMDTQGYDLKVFQGALNTISYTVCLLSELSLIPLYTGMPNYIDTLREYEKQGFAVTGLYPIVRMNNQAIIEIDAMFINNKNTKHL